MPIEKIPKAKFKFRDHRQRARRSNIEFLFTFDEWLEIWIKSGHARQRGCHKGQYVMARFNDTGPYSKDNVKIIKHAENIREGCTGKPLSAERKAKIAAAHKGKKHSAKTKAKMSKAHIGKTWKWSPEAIARRLARNTEKG